MRRLDGRGKTGIMGAAALRLAGAALLSAGAQFGAQAAGQTFAAKPMTRYMLTYDWKVEGECRDFAEDPEGGDEFVRALHSEIRNGKLLLSLNAPEALLLRFLRAQEAFFGGRKHARGGASGPTRVNDGKH